MRWINLVFISSLFTFLSCEIGEAKLDSCLDIANYTIDTPGVGFCPELVSGSVGDDIDIQIYALEVPDVAGIHAQIQYDASKVDIISISSGDFFERSQMPIFIFDDNNEGLIDIYTFFMSNEMTTQGIGEIAEIKVTLKSYGESEFIITTKSEFLDYNDVEIPIEGFGRGIVNAK